MPLAMHPLWLEYSKAKGRSLGPYPYRGYPVSAHRCRVGQCVDAALDGHIDPLRV
jgi:hypothetical protein